MYKYATHIILLLDLSLFYLVPLPIILSTVIGNYQKLGIVCFVLFNLIFYFGKIFNNKKYLFIHNMMFFTILFISELFLSKLNYGQDLKSLILSSNHYIVLLSYFIITRFISENNNKEIIEKIVLVFTIIVSVVLLVQYIIYNLNGNTFLFINWQRAIKSMRFGNIRIYESTYFPIGGSVMALGIFLGESNISKKLSLATFIVAFLHLLIVSKNRMGLVMVIVSAAYMIWIKYNKNIVTKLMITLILLFSFIGILNIPIINQFISTINFKDHGIAIRTEAIEYYLNQISDNPLFGSGFIQPIENDESFNIVRGPYGKFYKDDVGIIGIVNTFGVIGIIWYIMLAIKVLRVLIRIKRRNQHEKFLELYGLYILIFVGSIVMNPLDPQRIVLFPIFISLIDYSNKLIVKVNN